VRALVLTNSLTEFVLDCEQNNELLNRSVLSTIIIFTISI